MKTLLVQKSQLMNELQVPSSKSQTHRAILMAALAKNKSIIHHPLFSSDTRTMIEACRCLGAQVNIHANHLEVEGTAGKIVGSEDVIQANNSGIVLRFISAIAALGSQPIVITGDHSIRHQRPMQIMLSSLSQLGVRALSTRGDGFAPIIIQGPLKPGKCQIADGADSQNISPLLLAAVFLEGTLELEVVNPGEKPWVDITLDWLKRLGVPYQNHQYEKYKIQGIGVYPGFEYTVPGDWSSAAFPIGAALVTQSELTLRNLDIFELQGDKKIIDIFNQMGAHIDIDDQTKTLHINKGMHLKGVTVDINDCIDVITLVAAVACYADGETRITNASVARQKECNRITCVAAELSKMGACIQETTDGLIIKGASLRGTTVFSHGDHRMAMALAIAGMGAKGETCIQETSCIAKTYPSFVKDFQSIGANFYENP